MKAIYIAVVAFLVLSILALIGTFVLLDQSKRKTFYYSIKVEGRESRSAKIDRIRTEDKTIYKSAISTPFHPLFTEHKTRLTLEKDYSLDSLSREKHAKGGAVETRYLYRKGPEASFVSRFESAFAFIEGMKIKSDSFVFDEDSPVTYMPLLENYDFSRGRSQGFNALTFPPEQSLPPLKRYVTLTSIRDEYVKIGKRKIKTENLVLKSRNYPAGNVWVAKSDRSLIKVEIPDMGLTITRVLEPSKIEAAEYLPAGDAYTARKANFNNKKIKLAGTLTVPKKDLPSPGVLLVWGEGPQDRNYQGLFSTMADSLSSSGLVVLRFDKRGTGSSEGDAGALTEKDESDDIAAAIDYLAAQKEVQPGKIALIAHSKGARTAIMAASEKETVRCIVFMAPDAGIPSREARELATVKEFAPLRRWSDDYIKLAERSVQATYKRAVSSKHDWGYVLGKLCFTKRMKESMEDLSPYINKLKSRVLVLYGKKDGIVGQGAISELEKVIGQTGVARCTLTYYSYLGHFFGKQIRDGTHRLYYQADKEVLENIISWFGMNFSDETDKADKNI